MKIIETGSVLQIKSDNLKTYDQLPVGFYSIRCGQFTGFYLEKHAPIEVNEEKIYGVHTEKIEKVFKTFKIFSRNLGVILSGEKGIGKSLSAKLMTLKAIENGIPVIIVDEFIPGIANYIASIEQEVLVLFDEFDKTFDISTGDNAADAQASLLTLFDGIETGKKLFVITCNSIYKLNDFLVNRPGRFHYHFRFEYPTGEEVKQYLEDKLDKQYYGEINDVISFTRKVNINYDCLRAIAFELNTGLSFKDAIKDLNILNTDNEKYTLTIYSNNHSPIVIRNKTIDMFSTKVRLSLYDEEDDFLASIEFDPTKSKFDPLYGVINLDGQFVTITKTANDCYDEEDIEENVKNILKDFKISNITIERVLSSNLHYNL